MRQPGQDETRKTRAVQRPTLAQRPSAAEAHSAVGEAQKNGGVQAPMLVERLTRSPLGALLIIGLVLGGMVLLAVGGGYRAGVNERRAAAATAQAAELGAQFELASEDMRQGNYNRAIQRLSYIVENNPAFRGAAQLLAEAQQAYNRENQVTATLALPTPTPRPASTASTPEEMLAEVEAAQASGDWELMVGLAIELRAAHPDYQRIRVDGLLFRGLRNVGVARIQSNADELELGLFYLNEASKIGVLDVEAEQHALWAYFYISGASYIGLDWPRAIDSFTTVYNIAPYFHDTGVQLARAYAGYGDQLAAGGALCDAQLVYEAALEVRPGDDGFEAKRATAEAGCLSGEDAGTPDPGATLDPSVTLTPALRSTPAGETTVIP